MDFQEIIVFLYNDAIRFYHSKFFLLIKILLGIYTAILFIDIVLLLAQRGLMGNLRETMYGMDIPKEVASKKKKLRNKWLKIKKRLESSNPNDYKIAVIEADDVINGIVAGLGYDGENFGERLANIPASQIVNIDGIKRAHEARNKIIHNENFVLSQEDAVEIFDQYEDLLKSFQINLD